jgi:hypothetical protein
MIAIVRADDGLDPVDAGMRQKDREDPIQGGPARQRAKLLRNPASGPRSAPRRNDNRRH